MRFRFCGDLDCPDWVLSEIVAMASMEYANINIVAQQVVSHALTGKFNFENIARAVFNTDNPSSSNYAFIKGVAAAIHYIITNAVKHDVDSSSLLQEIQQLGLQRDTSELLTRTFNENKDQLQSQLTYESYRIASLVSTSWSVPTNQNEPSNEKPKTRIGTINLEITSKSGGADRFKNLKFNIDADKLDVLLYELEVAEASLGQLST